MPSRLSGSKKRENLTKLILIAVFLGGFGLFITLINVFGPGLSAFQPSWLDLVMLGLATYRLGRLISYDLVTEPLRRGFTETLPDSSGAGETVEPKGEGFQKAMGQLISCPICSGTWVAALLVFGLYLWPDAMRVFLAMTSAIGAAELIGSASESLSWSATYHRTLTGGQLASRRRNIVRIEQQPCDDRVPEQDEVRSLTERVKKNE